MSVPTSARHRLRRFMILLVLGAFAIPTLLCGEEADRRHWDATYAKKGYRYGLHALPVLREWEELLTSRAKGGRALDIAAGEGQNGIALARLGYGVDCVDISPVGLSKARTLARAMGQARRIRTIQADLETYRLEENAYDCILNIRFLLRPLAPQIVRALRPGGILVLETFTKDDPKALRPGANLAHFLDRNEALRLFDGLFVLSYAERMVGGRAVATLVARKPGPGIGLEHARPRSVSGEVEACCDQFRVRE